MILSFISSHCVDPNRTQQPRNYKAIALKMIRKLQNFLRKAILFRKGFLGIHFNK